MISRHVNAWGRTVSFAEWIEKGSNVKFVTIKFIMKICKNMLQNMLTTPREISLFIVSSFDLNYERKINWDMRQQKKVKRDFISFHKEGKRSASFNGCEHQNIKDQTHTIFDFLWVEMSSFAFSEAFVLCYDFFERNELFFWECRFVWAKGGH